MDDTIQQQQLRLEFGENYAETYARTRSFVKGLIGKQHWWTSQRQLLQCEGPLSLMVEHCLTYIVEAGSREAGYKAYTSYLTSNYGTSQSHTQNMSLSDPVAYSSAVTTDHLDPFGADASVKHEVVQHVVEEWWPISDEEKEFVVACSKMGVTAGGALFGLSRKQAWSRWRTLQTKFRRLRENPPKKPLSEEEERARTNRLAREARAKRMKDPAYREKKRVDSLKRYYRRKEREASVS